MNNNDDNEQIAYGYITVSEKDMPKRKSRVPDIVKGVCGLLVSLLIMVATIHHRDAVSAMAGVSYAGLLLACFAANSSVLVPASSSLIVIGAASALNPFLCGVIGGLGASLGEQVSYWVGRSGSQIAGDIVVISDVREWIDKHGFLVVFLFSLLPLPIYDIAGIAAGANRFSWVKYTIACALGKIPKMIAYACLGAYMIGLMIGFIQATPYADNTYIRQIIELFSVYCETLT